MAIHDKNGLLNRMLQLIRSAGINGKTTAQNVRDFITDLIDTMFSLAGSGSGSGSTDFEWDPEEEYNTTDNKFAISRLRIFKSKVDNNIGNEPPYIADEFGNYEDDFWVEVSAAPKSGIIEYAPGVFLDSDDLAIVYHNSSLYLLTADRPFESVDIAAEIANGDWIDLTGGGGTGVLEPVQDITELKNINTTDAEEYPDKWAILVEDEGQWYRFDRDSAVSESLPRIVAPTTGIGRWIRDQDTQLNGKVDKDNTIENGEILQKKEGGSYEGTGINSADLKSVNEVTAVANAYTLDGNSRYEKKFKTTTTITTNSAVSLTGGVEGAFINWRFAATGTIELDFSGSAEPVMFDANDSNYNDTTGVYSCAGDTDSKFELSAHYDGAAWLVRVGGPYV